MTILQNYLKNKRVQKVLTTKPGEEGFSLIELVVVIAVLAILSAVAIPSFTNVQANARASAVQNGLVNGIKECFVLQADDPRASATEFSDAASFAAAGAFRGFTLRQRSGAAVPLGGDTCFAAEAAAVNAGQDSDFTIYVGADGVAVKTCTRGEFAGCTPNSGNSGAGTW
jgi:prepilin-type N-terminal cleavage/methylation domain-containing protein